MKKFFTKVWNVISAIIMAVVIIVPLGCTVYLVYSGAGLGESTVLTQEDWDYMHNYINEKWGNGEEFHVVSENTDLIQTSKRTVKSNRVSTQTHGVKVTIIGYFDSQDNMYAVVFAKYSQDRTGYEAGKISLVTAATTRTKEEYFEKSGN